MLMDINVVNFCLVPRVRGHDTRADMLRRIDCHQPHRAHM